MKLTKEEWQLVDTHQGLHQLLEDAEKLKEFKGKFVVSGNEYREFTEDAGIIEQLKKVKERVDKLGWDDADIPPDIFQKLLDGKDD